MKILYVYSYKAEHTSTERDPLHKRKGRQDKATHTRMKESRVFYPSGITIKTIFYWVIWSACLSFFLTIIRKDIPLYLTTVFQFYIFIFHKLFFLFFRISLVFPPFSYVQHRRPPHPRRQVWIEYTTHINLVYNVMENLWNISYFLAARILWEDFPVLKSRRNYHVCVLYVFGTIVN